MVAQRLERAMRHHLDTWRARLEACQQRRVLKDPWASIRTMEQRLDELSMRLARAVRARVRLSQEALKQCVAAITHLNPSTKAGLMRTQLTALQQRLTSTQSGHLRREREELERLTATLQALSPLAVLARGYSICRQHADGQVIREANAVAPGMQVDITLWQGSLQCTVDVVMTKGSDDARTGI
jgi:exodeoxyribonuclease VII large subunit